MWEFCWESLVWWVVDLLEGTVPLIYHKIGMEG